MKKTKAAEASKGFQKISSFFKKTPTKSTETIKIKQEDTSCDEKPVLEAITNFPKIGSPSSKKRKNLESNASDCNQENDFKKSKIIKPSTSEYLSPSKCDFFMPFKSPDRLSANICDQMLTPEKNIQKGSPFKTNGNIEGNSNDWKRTPLKGKSPGSGGKRRTPKKLFEKSPSKLNEFNVEIINNFVKITPSKKSVREECDVFCDTKIQSTLKGFFSRGKASPLSIEAQNQNEKTPHRSPNRKFSTPSSGKARTKLDFSDCQETMKTSCEIKEEIENFDFNDSWDCDEFEMPSDYNLDLGESKHCKVTNIDRINGKLKLILKSTNSEEHAVCYLENFCFQSGKFV